MVSLRRIALILALVFGPALALGAGVDINTADAETLATAINGVGMKKASAIVAYRSQHGPFKSVDELTLVDGIGPGIVDKNRTNLTTKTASNASK